MRRAEQQPLEVTVTAPTLGLVTRIPSNQPDARAAVIGINMRFDDGVARNAPGYEVIQTTPALDSPVNMIHLATLAAFGTVTRHGFIATSSRLFRVGS